MKAKDSLVTVSDLRLAYGEFEVLRDINFEVKKGSCLVIMGGSGCGKSTLLKSMIGLLPPREGKIAFRTEELWKPNFLHKNTLLRKFGVLFQGGALWSSMTLIENVSLPLEIHTSLQEDEIREIARYKLSLVGLSGFEDFYPSAISGGMRKRAGIARAMALDPEVLFFDEPSAGLDPVNAKKLDDLINELKVSLGVTFVVVTHELASIFEIADDSIFLDPRQKTITARGNPHSLLQKSQDQRVQDFLRRKA